jgi:hypothetical protein
MHALRPSPAADREILLGVRPGDRRDDERTFTFRIARLKALKRENRELCQANEILRNRASVKTVAGRPRCHLPGRLAGQRGGL